MENNKQEPSELSAYQTPEAELLDTNNSASNTLFFPVSLTKLKVMYIATLGVYSLVWFYHNWKLQQPRMEKKIWPVWRAILSIFFTHSLFERMSEKTKENNLAEWPHQGLATFYVVFVILGSVADGVIEKIESISALAPASLLLALLPLYALIQAQKKVNSINNDPQGQLNNHFSAVNILFIILGFIWWALVFVGSFFLMTEQAV